MNPIRNLATAITLTALFAGASFPASAAGRQDDPFSGLKAYDYQSRTSVDTIRLMVQESLGDSAKTAAIEQKLIGVLSDKTTTLAGKQEACHFLWIIGSARSVPTLSKMLTDEKLSDMARFALERNTDPSAARALIAVLPKAKGKFQIGIINSLGNRGEAISVPALKPFTTKPSAQISEAAINALGKIGSPEALAVLIALPASNVTAGKALLRAAEKQATTGKVAQATKIYGTLAAAGHPSLVRAEAIRGLAVHGSPLASTLALESLKSSDPYLQQVAARICGSLPDIMTTSRSISAWPTLPVPAQTILLTSLAERHATGTTIIGQRALDSTAPPVRLAGIRSSVKVGTPNWIPRLVAFAIKGEPGEKEAARESLASLPGPGAEKAILELARSGKPAERAVLMSVLAERPSTGAITVLMTSANDMDTKVATEALRSLGRVGTTKEYGSLISLLVSTQNEDIRDSIKDAVVAIGHRVEDRDSAAAPLLSAYTSASATGKAAVLAALAETGGERALDTLTWATTASEEDVRQAAIKGLAETWSDSRPAPALLQSAKNDTSKSLRIQSLRGYIRLTGQDDKLSVEEKVEKINAAIAVSERSEEKRQALGILRDCRVATSVESVAKMLDDSDLFTEAADTVLYLAAPQKKGDREQVAVKGEATTTALKKIIEKTKDDNQRSLAQKLL